MNKKGTCGCCQKRFVLNKDNTLRKHGHLNNFWGGKRVTSFCIGSDNLPLKISNVTYQISFNRDKRILAKAEAKDDRFKIEIYSHCYNRSLRLLNQWQPIQERV